MFTYERKDGNLLRKEMTVIIILNKYLTVNSNGQCREE